MDEKVTIQVDFVGLNRGLTIAIDRKDIQLIRDYPEKFLQMYGKPLFDALYVELEEAAKVTA